MREIFRNSSIDKVTQNIYTRRDSEAGNGSQANDRQSASMNLLKTQRDETTEKEFEYTNFHFSTWRLKKRKEKKTWKIIEILSDKNYRKVFTSPVCSLKVTSCSLLWPFSRLSAEVCRLQEYSSVYLVGCKRRNVKITKWIDWAVMGMHYLPWESPDHKFY